MRTGYTQFRPLTGTALALVGSGDLQLVRNDSIRFQVVAYVALIDATEALLRHTESLIWNSTERIMLGRLLHSRSTSSTTPPGTSGWGPIDVAAALSDPEMVSALQVQVAASNNRVRNLRRLEEPTAALIRTLEARIRGN